MNTVNFSVSVERIGGLICHYCGLWGSKRDAEGETLTLIHQLIQKQKNPLKKIFNRMHTSILRLNTLYQPYSVSYCKPNTQLSMTTTQYNVVLVDSVLSSLHLNLKLNQPHLKLCANYEQSINTRSTVCGLKHIPYRSKSELFFVVVAIRALYITFYTMPYSMCFCFFVCCL